MGQKTNKSVKKRFKITKKGKVMRRRGPKNHLRAKKSQDVIRNARKRKEIGESEGKKIKEDLLPHN